MNGRRMGPCFVASTFACLLALGSCASNKAASTSSPSSTALLPVSLPDLTRAEKSAQEQLREAYSSLTTAIEHAGVTAAELGADYGRLGTLLMSAEYFRAAEPCFLNAHALVPNEVRWPYYLGHVYRAMNEPEKAATFFEQSAQLRPDYDPMLVWLGDAYLELDRPGAAEPQFSKVLSRHPESAPALFGLGRTALARRDYSQAVALLEKTLSLNDRASGVRYALARAYRGLGEVEKAEAQLRQLGPMRDMGLDDPLMQEIDGLLHSSMAYRASGVWSYNAGDRAASLDYFRKATELAPREPFLRQELGTALFLAGDERAAAEQYQEALRLSPTFAKSHYSLGVVMARNGQQQEAIKHFSEAVKIDPSYVEARLNLGDILRQLGRPQESIGQYEQVLRLDPRVAEARLGYALALVDLKRYREARAILMEAKEAYPDRHEFADLLARLNRAEP